MKKRYVLLLPAVAFLAGAAGAWVFQSENSAKPLTDAVKSFKESTYDRVMRTQTIRCGYILWNPSLIKDPNTGHLSGIFYDYVEALGKALHLKIEWAEEMGWGDFPAALDNGRIDVMCGGSYANSARARVIDFVRPILYQPMYAYVRADDKRFDNNLDAINDPAVTIITVEGATPSVVAAQDFPKAKNIQLPEMTSLSENFVNLAAGKGDVVILYSGAFSSYDSHNPGKIRRVSAKIPLRVFGDSLAVAGGQDQFRRMLDIATDEMILSGQIDKIIAKYDQNPDALLRVAPPYQNNETAR